MISISWNFVTRLAGAAFLSAFCATAGASFHLYKIEQIYSDASGNVQYVMFATPDTPSAAGQQFLTTHQVVAANSSNNNTYTFMSDLPATMAHTTQNTKFLVATQSFANLGLVIPDYIVPDAADTQRHLRHRRQWPGRRADRRAAVDALPAGAARRGADSERSWPERGTQYLGCD